jgi:eukaryotic-like serine/threonine-protein kinase
MLRELQPGDPRTIGPYRLLGQLGEGGTGRVYLGLSEGGRPVAVKVIRADLAADPDFRMRFRREVAAARKVNGLYTALVVDADPDASAPWLATAYVAGPSLAEAVRNHGALPVAAVLTLAAGLAEGLAAIHAAGLVHRDLKPSNVLLAEDGPRVIDFGISRAAEATSVTHTGLVIGSPGFLSPEQAQGHHVGPPTDVFSLGAVLAFAVTGRPPFGEGPTAALVYRVVHDPAQMDQVPGQIRPLVERCLAKDPSQRPSARDVLAEVGAAQPVTGWLPEPISHAFTPYQVPASPGPVQPPPAHDDPITLGPAWHSQTPATARDASSTITGKNQRWQAPLPGVQHDLPAKRRHRARALTLAGIAAAVLAGSAITGYALMARHPTVPRIPGDAAAANTTSITSASTVAPSPHTSDPRTKRPRPRPTTQPPQSVAPAAVSPAPAVTQPSTTRPPSTHPSAHPSAHSSTPSPSPSPKPSPTSASPQGPPAAPSNLTVNAPDASDIELNWQVNSSDQTGFEINNGVTSAYVGAGSTSYDWGGLSAGTYMCFKILAYNSAGDSAWYPDYSPWYVCTTTP